MTNGLIQTMTIEESAWHKWVKPFIKFGNHALREQTFKYGRFKPHATILVTNQNLVYFLYQIKKSGVGLNPVRDYNMFQEKSEILHVV